MELLNSGPKGLGGWLVLPAIGMFITPVLILALLGNTFLPMFGDGTWDALTSPESDVYHPLWGPTLSYEILGNIGLLIFDLVLLVLFFMKSHLFPKLYIAFAALNVIFLSSDLFLAALIPGVAEQFGYETFKDLIRGIIGAVIWIPYMLVSKRVKNTFVKPGQEIIRSMPVGLADPTENT